MLDVTGKKQPAHHVKDQQSLHTVKGNALPQLRTGEDHQSRGMAKYIATAAHRPKRCDRDGNTAVFPHGILPHERRPCSLTCAIKAKGF